MGISSNLMRPTNARMEIVLITYYLLPTCLDVRRGHRQGKLQDYKDSKQTVKMLK